MDIWNEVQSYLLRNLSVQHGTSALIFSKPLTRCAVLFPIHINYFGNVTQPFFVYIYFDTCWNTTCVTILFVCYRDNKCSNLAVPNPFCLKPKNAAVDERTLLMSLSLTGEECVTESCKCNARSHKTQRWNSSLCETNLKSPIPVKRNILRKSKLNFVSDHSIFKHKFGYGGILKDPVLKLANFSPLGPKIFSLIKVRPENFGIVRSDITLPQKAENNNNEPFGHNVILSDFKSLLIPVEGNSTIVKSGQAYNSVNFRHLRSSTSRLKITDDGNSDSVRKATSANSGSHGQTCSQQALMSTPTACDDVTIDELASYFDVFVHIPKKMSHMAEMMYI